MWSIDVNDASCYDYGGLGLQSLVESLIFFHTKKGSNSSRSNFKPLGSLCFTSFDHWMRFMVNGRYQWHQNEWFFSENTPNICFLHLLSFLFLCLTRKNTNITMLFVFPFLGAGHVKKERKKVKPGSNSRPPYFQLPKKKVSLFCVCHQTSLVLRFLRSFVHLDLGWPALALRARSGGRHERGRTTASTGVEDAGERTCHGMVRGLFLSRDKGMGVPRPQCTPWYLYSWCWFLGGL